MRSIAFFLFLTALPVAYAEFSVERQSDTFTGEPLQLHPGATVLGKFRFDFESGFYTGATRFRRHEESENDTRFWRSYAGYRDSLGAGFGWHTGVSLYRPQDASFWGLTEIYGGLQYKYFSTRVSVSPLDKAGYGELSGMRTRLEAGMNMELANGLGFGFSVGRYADAGVFGDETAYQLHLNKTYQGFGLGFDVTNRGYTDDQQILPGILDDTRFNFTVTREF